MSINEYFFCANRYAKTLTSNNLTFPTLAELFSKPFVALDKDATGIFPGHYVAPYRQIQNIDYHNLIILDIDDHEQSEILLNHIRQSSPYLAQFNYIVYSTFSSAPDKLRLRLIIQINTENIREDTLIGIDEYPAATRTVEAALNLTVDPCSHKRNSFVYTPRIQPGAEYLYSANRSGRAFEKSDIDSAQYFHTSSRPDADFTDQQYDPEAIDEETLTAMLSSISPDCDYHTWIKVIAAMHHHSGGAKSAFDLINDWSSKGKKYCGPDDLWYKWTSITDEVEIPVTIGTLIYLANQNHWHSRHLSKVAIDLKTEIGRTKELFSTEEYVHDFAKRVSKYKFSGIMLSSIVNDLVDAAAITMNLDKRTKSKLVKDLEARCKFGGLYKDMNEQERKEATPAWARDFVVVTGISNDVKFANLSVPFDPEVGPIILSNDRFNAENVNRKTEPNQDLAILAREYFDLPHVHTIKFDPSNGTIFQDRTGKRCLNSFVRNESFYYGADNTFTPFQKEVKNALTRFLEFYIPDSDQRHIMLNYIAYNIFNLGYKVQWAPLVVTTEGYGKDTFMHLLEVALGKYRKHFLKIDGAKFLDPQWTSMLEHRSFIHVNEVYAGTSKRSPASEREKIFNTIKDRITDSDAMRISTKYQNDRVIQQVTNYSFTSNAMDALTFSRTERRLLVLWPERYHENPTESKAEIRPILEFIWTLLHSFGIGSQHYRFTDKDNQLRNQIREAVLSYFGYYGRPENYHPEFRPSGEAYRTPEFYEMSNLNRDVLHDSIDEMIADDANVYITKSYCCVNQLLVLLNDHYRTNNIRTTPIRSDVVMYLRQIGYYDIAEFKEDLRAHEDMRADVAAIFGGTFGGKTKFFMTKEYLSDWRACQPITVTQYAKRLYGLWKDYIKYREFDESDANVNAEYGSTTNALTSRAPTEINPFFH